MLICNMSSFNSFSSFREEDFLFDDIPIEWTSPEKYKEIKVHLDKTFLKEKEILETLVDNTKSTFFSLEDKIKYEKDNQERKREKKNMIFTKVSIAKQSLEELLMRKKALNADLIEMVSKNELSEMLQKVVQLEKEQEVQQDDMKMKVKVFIGQMCFYKKFLNVYVEIPNSGDYIFYFRKCKAEDINKPQERIRIKTDNFKTFIDIASSEKSSNELLKLIHSYDKHLRELIIEARELLCFNA